MCIYGCQADDMMCDMDFDIRCGYISSVKGQISNRTRKHQIEHIIYLFMGWQEQCEIGYMFILVSFVVQPFSTQNKIQINDCQIALKVDFKNICSPNKRFLWNSVYIPCIYPTFTTELSCHSSILFDIHFFHIWHSYSGPLYFSCGSLIYLNFVSNFIWTSSPFNQCQILSPKLKEVIQETLKENWCKSQPLTSKNIILIPCINFKVKTIGWIKRGNIEWLNIMVCLHPILLNRAYGQSDTKHLISYCKGNLFGTLPDWNRLHIYLY